MPACQKTRFIHPRNKKSSALSALGVVGGAGRADGRAVGTGLFLLKVLLDYVGNKEARARGGVGHHPGITRMSPPGAQAAGVMPGVFPTPGMPGWL